VKNENCLLSKCDSHTISADGHFIGHDGFVVPRNFAEFYERYPRYVRGFVRRGILLGSERQCEDRESELLLHLMSLPPKSKYRRRGCTDRIQVFNPRRTGGADRARFFAWLKVVLTNRSRNLYELNQIRRTVPLYGDRCVCG
jgi:hypothetical protein